LTANEIEASWRMTTTRAPSLSVIIPSYQRGAALCQTVEDLLVQRVMPQDILVILQQADSSDDFTRRLRDWSKAGKIRLYEVDFANAQRARNLGISEAKGDVILLIDDDVRLSPNVVEQHWMNYCKDPSLDGVVGQVLEVNQFPTLEKSVACSWKHIGWEYFPLNYADRSPTFNWPSSNASVRRSIALAVGGFDEQFERTYLDDTDFSVRLKKYGAKLMFDPQASLVHLKVPSGGKRIPTRDDLRFDQSGWATHFYFWRKNHGLWKAKRAVWWHFRYLIFRKAVLLRPHWLLKNGIHVIRGFRLATEKLRDGPKYLGSEEKEEGVKFQ
jgi:GT2 family glycosyltransferase